MSLGQIINECGDANTNTNNRKNICHSNNFSITTQRIKKKKCGATIINNRTRTKINPNKSLNFFFYLYLLKVHIEKKI
jgi:hypothetical protein